MLKSYLRGVEEHPVEQRRGGFQRRRIAGTQLAVDFDQRFVRRVDGVLIERARNDDADVVAIREEDIHVRDSRFADRGPHFRRQRLVRFEQHFAGLPIHQLADRDCAFEIGDADFDLRHARLHQFLVERLGDALVRADQRLARLRMLDLVRELAVDQAFGSVPEEIAVAQRDALDLVERAQDILIRLHSQRAQEDRAEKFALAVNAHVQNVLCVVLELDPRAAIRNDLAQEIAAVVGRLEEHAGRAVQLADDHALGAVDDERAVLGHQRNVAEENFLFLDVADGFRAGVGILVVNRQADGDLERRGIGHAALLALVHVVLQLQRDRIAALVAECRRVLVERAALRAEHVAGLVRIGDHRRAATAAGGAQVVQPAQVAALALPVADRIVHEIQLRQPAEILDRENGSEYRLQARVFPLARQQIHLQEALIGLLLNVDQVRNLDSRLNLGEVQAFPFPHDAITVTMTHGPSPSGLRRSGNADRHPPRRSGKDNF